MKRFFYNSLLLFLCMGGCVLFCCVNNGQKESGSTETTAITSVSQNGFLSIQGASLVNEKGQPVMLRGVGFGWHNWWPRFYNEQTVAWLKEDWKINVIRPAIGVLGDRHEDSFLQNPKAAYDCLYTVVDAAIKHDIYVIIDWHAHDIHRNEAIDFFKP